MDRVYEMMAAHRDRQAGSGNHGSQPDHAAPAATLAPRPFHLDHSRGLPIALPSRLPCSAPAFPHPTVAGASRAAGGPRRIRRRQDERRRCVQADPADGAVHPPGGRGEGQRDLRLRRGGQLPFSPLPLHLPGASRSFPMRASVLLAPRSGRRAP